jgi:hypothetical protein
MNPLSLLAKLVIVPLIATILATLGTCTLRSARATLRVRRVDELEQASEDTP